ncbi:MAG: hypothetical protein JO022_18585 [Acidobacteriaceae bacterium]|nr:hypothetical protein [Acidobacteriaceae bacterium]
MMKRSLLLLVLACTVSAQDNNFQGTWEAKFKGTIFCILNINESKEVSGSLVCGSLSVDDSGELTEVGAPGDRARMPLQQIKADERIMSFAVDDGDGPMKFEFRITGEERAELRFLDAPQKINPIRFTRQ